MAITKEEVMAVVSSEVIATRDCNEIARIVSIGRKKPNSREIGNGTILETIGFVAGNALLDEIQSNPNFRYVKPLVEQGRMVLGSALVQATLQSLVPRVLTASEANKLAALGFEPNPCSAQEVAEALFNADGSLK